MHTFLDRRHFLAATGLAVSSSVLTRNIEAGARDVASTELFKQINFTSDGLGLDPREYVTLLHEASKARKLEADYYSNGGCVRDLEQKFAQLLGKEAAMFVPTGTLANHLAIRKLAGTDRRVLVQAESHFYNDSGDCAETLSGLTLIPLAVGRSTIELSEVKRWVERSAGGRVETKIGVISVENPVRRNDHEMVDVGELERVCSYARSQGIRLHLDGARMFNLPFHSGKSIREYSALFDTVYVSLWKHFNGASGAILAGDAKFIEGMFHLRRMFGGSLPQAWPEIALVTQYVDGFEDEYTKAWRTTDQLIELLRSDGRFKVQKIPNGTSRFLLTVSGTKPEELTERVLKKGVILPHARPDTGVFPMQVNPTIMRMTPTALAQIFADSIRA
jgi:threonine aldolase